MFGNDEYSPFQRNNRGSSFAGQFSSPAGTTTTPTGANGNLQPQVQQQQPIQQQKNNSSGGLLGKMNQAAQMAGMKKLGAGLDTFMNSSPSGGTATTVGNGIEDYLGSMGLGSSASGGLMSGAGNVANNMLGSSGGSGLGGLIGNATSMLGNTGGSAGGGLMSGAAGTASNMLGSMGGSAAGSGLSSLGSGFGGLGGFGLTSGFSDIKGENGVNDAFSGGEGVAQTVANNSGPMGKLGTGISQIVGKASDKYIDSSGTTGDILSDGGTGATIGGTYGGPWGAAIGGILGGLYGGAKHLFGGNS